MSEKKQGEAFGSIIGFLLTTIGFAVGVGSLWRFPYVCGTNGGAFFIITYVVVIVLIGIPLLTAEISIGYATKLTATNAYKQLTPGKKWYYASYLHIIVAVSVFCYTVPIYVWILTYIWRTGSGFFTGLSSEDIATSFGELNADYKTLILFAIINWLIVGLIISGKNVVEKANKVLLPGLAVIMVVCIILGLRIDGAEKGLSYMFKPNPENFSFGTITAAIGQSFFAIGIGMLASMIFGSYLKNKNENILKHATIISSSIIVAGVAAGLMIFPMVFAFNLEPGAGVGLTMITLPNVFNHISGGRIIGTLFYIGFYFAALSSAIGLGEAIVAVVKDGFNIERKKAVGIVMTIAVLVGTCSLLIPGFLDITDIVTSNYLLVISGLLIAIYVGWIWGVKNCLDVINVKSKFLRTWIGISIKYLCPIAILIIFIGNFI